MQLSNSKQRLGVLKSIAAYGNHEVIATAFSLMVNLATEIPCDGMEEQHRFEQSLDDNHHMVATPKMAQFVSQHCVQLLQGESADHGGRDQNHRSQQSDNDRHCDLLAGGDDWQHFQGEFLSMLGQANQKAGI